MSGHTDQDTSIQCLLRWLRFREQNGKSFPASLKHFEELVSTSSLLPLLLRGEQPYEVAPPLSFSQPWYGIMEQAQLCTKVRHGDHFDRHVFGCDVLWINEYGWRVVKQHTEGKYTITYADGSMLFKAETVGELGGVPLWNVERVTTIEAQRIPI